MPNPNNYKDKSSFMKVCVPMVIKEGTAKDGSQGYAICQDMWAKHLKNKRAKGEQLTKPPRNPRGLAPWLNW
jgi:hypothetical protein